MLDPTEFGERLEESTNAIAAAKGPSDVFRALLDGFALAAPRAAMFLVRQGSLTGWSSIGHGAAESERIRGSKLPSGSGWPGRRVAPDAPDRAFRSSDDRNDARDLGSVERHESLANVLRVGGRTLAVLLSEREPGERPWSPAAMGVLMTMARMRLEVDLARRRLRRGATAEASVVEAPAPATAVETATPLAEPGTLKAASLAPSREPEPAWGTSPESRDETGLAEAPVQLEQDGAAPGAHPELEAARRFARLIATDIRLYNEEDVLLGRRDGDLQHRMRDHLTRGEDTFRRRFPSIGDLGAGILHDAYVQVLAGGDDRLIDAGGVAGDRSGSSS